jgi:hypothetical protein
MEVPKRWDHNFFVTIRQRGGVMLAGKELHAKPRAAA